MHNLHFVVVSADSGESACNKVEDLLWDFGDENSWREQCGAVSQDNEVFLTGDGRFPPDEDSNTIEKINALVSGWINKKSIWEESFDKLLNHEILDASDWHGIKHYANHMCDTFGLKDKPVNVLDPNFNFRPYEYDECGVTNTDEFLEEGEKLWVVFVDMHS